MKRFPLFSMAAAAVLAVTAAQPAAARTSAGEFVTKATISNQFEIESSRIALEKSQSAEVKDLARQMIDDHTKAGNELEAALPKSTVKPEQAPKALDDKHRKIIDRLNAASGKDFDKEYLNAQHDAHKEAVSLFSAYARHGEDPVLKDFAAKTLPTLEKHKDHVEHVKD